MKIEDNMRQSWYEIGRSIDVRDAGGALGAVRGAGPHDRRAVAAAAHRARVAVPGGKRA